MRSTWTLLAGLVATARGELVNRTAVDAARQLPKLSVVNMEMVTVLWASGESKTLASGWLRERCLSAETVQPDTKQPLIAYHDLPASALHVNSAQLTDLGDTLHVFFADGHRSTYDMSRLLSELDDYETSFIQPSAFVNLPMTYWRAELVAPPTFDYAEFADQVSPHTTLSFSCFLYRLVTTSCSGSLRWPTTPQNETAGRLTVATHLLSTGLVLVKGLPTLSGQVSKLADELSFATATNWGNPFNVRTSGDAAQTGGVKRDLAYVDA